MEVINKFYCNFLFDEVYYIVNKSNRYYIPKNNNSESHIIELTNKNIQESKFLIIDKGYNINMHTFKKINLIATMPNPDFVLLIFGNIGYLLNGNLPDEYELINSYAIKDIYQDCKNNLILVFYDDQIIAYNNKNQIEWDVSLSSIFTDGYDVKLKKDTNITLEYYDERWDKNRFILLNNINGNIEIRD